MDEVKQKLQAAGFAGEMDDSARTRDFYSHDASLFEIKPQLVVAPRDTQDVQTLIQTVSELRKHLPSLSLTPTCPAAP